MAMTVATFGGLGNQMFQYAFGRAVGQLQKQDIILDKRYAKRVGERPYLLDALSVLSVAETKSALPDMPTPIERRLKWALPKRGVRYYFERDFAFDAAALRVAAPAYFWGVWQSPRYFEDIAVEVRQELQLRMPMSARRQQMAQEIVSSGGVCVHVRRGDYVTNARATAYHGVVPVEWYAEARDALEQRVGRQRYFVFSDDVEWTRKNLAAFDDAVFVQPDSDGRDFEDLHLMALGQHQIIANSSFSWWAAWLNSNPRKQIIAPARWFAAAHIDTRSLIPKEWLRL